jgi:DNA polymerase-3 subunit epsilon
VTDYLLFIDTETSGLPKDWKKPYSEKGNWPYCVQIGWIIYTSNGQEIKRENHYINEDDFEISDSATKIHGITKAFLDANGESRKEIMTLIDHDVRKYQPLVVGHFMEFDYNMLGADFYRTGIDNPIEKENTFCTMIATTHLVKNPMLKFFRLGELYEAIFHTKLYNQHNAFVDAKATAECFFELVKRGEINDDTIISQQAQMVKGELVKPGKGCLIPMFFIIFFTFSIFYFL